MNQSSSKFAVDFGWQILLKDLGFAPQDLLRQAGLPLDLFSQSTPALTQSEYFRFWHGLEQLLADDLAFPLRIAQAISVEAFNPPLFACICSDNLNLALKRLAKYKPLICPLRLNVEQTEYQTTIAVSELPGALPLPSSLVAMELIFFVQMSRLATRDRIVPLKVESSIDVPAPEQYKTFFGVPIAKGQANRVTFSAIDAQKPFLTSNAGMWSIFEPELNKRIKHLSLNDRFRDRVRASLMEILASGQCSRADVAQRLAVSPRTLQRRLQEEGTSFQQELSDLRSELANHYLANTPYSSAEISFLLGYSDPSSFFRAFHIWTGKTPDVVRELSRIN
ncbi:MAG: AraC family transcriptional regulator ligand-binding domain-containing protein [Cyanobacteria bacterium P01_F01_bin.150]